MDSFDKLNETIAELRETLRRFAGPSLFDALPQSKRCEIHNEFYQELWEDEWLCESCLCEFYEKKGEK